MASSNTEINLNTLDIVDLDYDSIKTSLKNFLRGQSQFKDYDYDGPNIATLLRLLSFNTYKNAFYTNMALSEAHLDSAQLRSSILSHAKDLNYTPRSSRSARARIAASFTATGESQPYVLQKGSLFSAVVKNTSYSFSLPETLTVASANTSFNFETDIYEGFFVKDSYVLQGEDNERFRISNKNVDTRSLTVTVYEDGAEVGDNYIYKQTLLDTTSKSKVFFLQTAEDGYYEILFGDNILGKRPKTNSTVSIDYRISAGPGSNGAKQFSMDFDPTNNELNSTPIVETIETAKNGREPENNESVRYFAPRNFQIQERTVVDQDYSIALKSAYPEINVIHAYGGEEANPPRMGKVFVSVDLTGVDGLPDNKVREYTTFLRKRSPFGIDPIFVEPDYMYIDIQSLVRYNVNITTNSPERIKTLVIDAIVAYNEINLDNFESTYRESAVSRTIDFADVSIVSSITEIRMYKKINVLLETSSNYVIDYGVAIRDTLPNTSKFNKLDREYAFRSDSFTFNNQIVFMEDDSTGIVRLLKRQNDVDVEIAKIGTIEYEKGIVNISGLNIQNFSGPDLKAYAYPKDKDVTSQKNTILGIEPSNISIQAEEIRIDQ